MPSIRSLTNTVKCLLCASARLLGASLALELLLVHRDPTQMSPPPGTPPTHTPSHSHLPTRVVFSLGTLGLACLSSCWAPATTVGLSLSSGQGRQCAWGTPVPLSRVQCVPHLALQENGSGRPLAHRKPSPPGCGASEIRRSSGFSGMATVERGQLGLSI